MQTPKKLAFLQAVVGVEGAEALSKAAARAPELSSVIYPRAMLAWLELVKQFDGCLPGTDSLATFRKSEAGYDGFVMVGTDPYDFKGADLYHLAGSVAVALGADHEPIRTEASTALLNKLGKQLDLLVKSQFVQKELRKASEAKAGKPKVQLPGQTAKPNEPAAPAAPTAKQPKPTAPQMGVTSPNASAGTSLPKPATGAQGATPKPSAPATKLPRPKLPGATVTKSEASARCSVCGRGQFAGVRFVGCHCYEELAKSVTVTEEKAVLRLSFGEGWDQEAVASLLSSWRK